MPNGHNPGPSYGRPPQMQGGPAPMGAPGYGPPGMGMGPPPGFAPMDASLQGPGPMSAPRGGSRALPIVVAAGLAIGVFGGLIIMNGTGGRAVAQERGAGATDELDAGAKVLAQVQPIDAAAPAAADAATSADAAQMAAVADAGPPDAGGDDGNQVAAADRDGDGDRRDRDGDRRSRPDDGDRGDSGSRSGDRGHRDDPRGDRVDPDSALTPQAFADSTPARVAESATLTFSVTPPSVPGLSITVNGQSADDLSATVALGGTAKKVKVVAKARGYRTWSRSYTVRRDQVIRIKLRRPTTNDAPGGLIDL